MKILFVHQNFPGQYLHLARYLGTQPEHQAVFITQRKDVTLPGVRKIVYQPRRTITPQVHHYLRESEAAVLNAQEVARIALDLRKAGFIPDVMLGHNGWGEIWYLKDIFPEASLIGYFEFFYRMTGADVGFDPTDPPNIDTAPRLRTKNLGNLLALDTVDLGQCPTEWQKSVYPRRYHPILNVIHEGVDSSVARPDPHARILLADQRLELRAGDEIVTYVARNLEAYRGFPSFMRSLPKVLAARPAAQVLIVGGDEISYGARLPEGETYKKRMLAELGDSLDLKRVHFLGKLPYQGFIKVLQVSRVHVYLTYPFVLSWSMLEAMSAGCLVVGSRTPPVQEVMHHGGNGLLVDFFSPDEIADRVIDALEDGRAFASLRRNARQMVLDRYDLTSICLPAHLRLLNTLVPRERRVALPGAASVPAPVSAPATEPVRMAG
jgi:glycosyltransferase involved in cell wall biosynthesis